MKGYKKKCLDFQNLGKSSSLKATKIITMVCFAMILHGTICQLRFVSLSDLNGNFSQFGGKPAISGTVNDKPVRITIGGRSFVISKKKKNTEQRQSVDNLKEAQVKPIRKPNVRPVPPVITKPIIRPTVVKQPVKIPKVNEKKTEIITKVKEVPKLESEEPKTEEVKIVQPIPLINPRPIRIEEKQKNIIEKNEPILQNELLKEVQTPETVEEVVEKVEEEPVIIKEEVEQIIEVKPQEPEKQSEPVIIQDDNEQIIEVKPRETQEEQTEILNETQPKEKEEVQIDLEPLQETGPTEAEEQLTQEILEAGNTFNFDNLMDNLDNLQKKLDETKEESPVVEVQEQKEINVQETQPEEPVIIKEEQESNKIEVPIVEEGNDQKEQSEVESIQTKQESSDQNKIQNVFNELRKSEDNIIKLDNSIPENEDKEEVNSDIQPKDIQTALKQKVPQTLENGEPSLLNMFSELMGTDTKEEVPVQQEKQSESVQDTSNEESEESVSAPTTVVDNQKASTQSSSNKELNEEETPRFKLKPAEFLSEPLPQSKPQREQPIAQRQQQNQTVPQPKLTPAQQELKQEQAQQQPVQPSVPEIPEALKVKLTRPN